MKIVLVFLSGLSDTDHVESNSALNENKKLIMSTFEKYSLSECGNTIRLHAEGRKATAIKWRAQASPNGAWVEHTAIRNEFGAKVTNFPGTRTIQAEITKNGEKVHATNFDKADRNVGLTKEYCLGKISSYEKDALRSAVEKLQDSAITNG
jgi:hypothetical protein